MDARGILEGIWKSDLPESLDPMTAKELRQGLRRGVFIYPFLAVQIFALIAIMVEFEIGHDSEATEYAGVLNFWMLANAGAFWIAIAVVCMVLMPLGGMILMGQELEDGNHELLLLTKLTRWKIVIGKFITLWGLTALTFISLLPYVVVRYWIGGIEWTHEAACAGTVLAGSAMLCAGAIGASAFKRVFRGVVFTVFVFSMVLSCGISLFFVADVSGGCGRVYHLTAFSAVICYVIIGLALARSRLRLALLAYETKPSSMVIGLMIFAPVVIGGATGATAGWGGLAGFLGVALVAVKMDSVVRPLPRQTRD